MNDEREALDWFLRQGHIAAKLMARNAVAAMTIGTPILLSSVAHSGEISRPFSISPVTGTLSAPGIWPERTPGRGSGASPRKRSAGRASAAPTTSPGAGSRARPP